MRDDAIALADEVEHLRVPVVRGQRPAVVEDDRLHGGLAPVFEIDVHTVLGGDVRGRG
jgi:hypothetical protein